MKMVPSTPGEVTIALRFKSGSEMQTPRHFAKFASIKEEVNALLSKWATTLNPVVMVEIRYVFPKERT